MDHSSDPDEWKSDPAEGPRHFLEMDIYGKEVPYPIAEAMAKVGPERFKEAGQLPWTIQERVLDLADAFRKGDREAVALQTAFLSHYVGDLHVPLHLVHNFNGQMTNQRGVHSRWETGLVDRMTNEAEVRPATLEPKLDQAPWRWLTESHALAATVLEDDRLADPEGGQAQKTETYWVAFNQRQGPVVKEQLARAGQRTAQLILQAWTLAGSPAVKPSSTAAPASARP